MKTPISTCAIVLLIAAFAQNLNGQNVSEIRISTYGLALPKQQVTLRSSIDSCIREIHVQEGQTVQKGDLLIELDCATALARREVSKLAAEETGPRLNAQAELDYATDNFHQVTDMYSRDAMTDRDLKEAGLRLKRAEAGFQIELERAAANEARFKLADAEVEQYFLRAPFSGRITRLNVNLGDSVISNTDILDLASMELLRVEIYLPLVKANSIQIGEICKLRIESPFEEQQIIDGKVVFRSPVIEATTGTLRLVFEINNRELKLPAGFTVALFDQTNTEQVPGRRVPSQLISRESAD